MRYDPAGNNFKRTIDGIGANCAWGHVNGWVTLKHNDQRWINADGDPQYKLFSEQGNPQKRWLFGITSSYAMQSAEQRRPRLARFHQRTRLRSDATDGNNGIFMGGESSDWNIAELVFYDRKLSDAELEDVKAWIDAYGQGATGPPTPPWHRVSPDGNAPANYRQDPAHPRVGDVRLRGGFSAYDGIVEYYDPDHSDGAGWYGFCTTYQAWFMGTFLCRRMGMDIEFDPESSHGGGVVEHDEQPGAVHSFPDDEPMAPMGRYSYIGGTGHTTKFHNNYDMYPGHLANWQSSGVQKSADDFAPEYNFMTQLRKSEHKCSEGQQAKLGCDEPLVGSYHESMQQNYPEHFGYWVASSADGHIVAASTFPHQGDHAQNRIIVHRQDYGPPAPPPAPPSKEAYFGLAATGIPVDREGWAVLNFEMRQNGKDLLDGETLHYIAIPSQKPDDPFGSSASAHLQYGYKAEYETHWANTETPHFYLKANAGARRVGTRSTDCFLQNYWPAGGKIVYATSADGPWITLGEWSTTEPPAATASWSEYTNGREQVIALGPVPLAAFAAAAAHQHARLAQDGQRLHDARDAPHRPAAALPERRRLPRLWHRGAGLAGPDGALLGLGDHLGLDAAQRRPALQRRRVGARAAHRGRAGQPAARLWRLRRQPGGHADGAHRARRPGVHGGPVRPPARRGARLPRADPRLPAREPPPSPNASASTLTPSTRAAAST